MLWNKQLFHKAGSGLERFDHTPPVPSLTTGLLPNETRVELLTGNASLVPGPCYTRWARLRSAETASSLSPLRREKTPFFGCCCLFIPVFLGVFLLAAQDDIRAGRSSSSLSCSTSSRSKYLAFKEIIGPWFFSLFSSPSEEGDNYFKKP